MSDILSQLSAFPRAELLSGPTPIERLPRLSDHFGVDLWIKRDDLTGLGFGGNKIRQLEFYFGDALASGADTVLITGAVQSNYVRATAAAANRLGMKTVIQLENRVPDMDDTYHQNGNVLLDHLLGAEIVHYPVGEDEAGADQALHDHADRLRAEGRTPYVIPLSPENPPLGALGYIRAADEILQQAPEGFDATILATGSGQTHAGLIFGQRALGHRHGRIYGICVRRGPAEQVPRITKLWRGLEALLDFPLPFDHHDMMIWGGALAPGYGQMGENARQALDDFARMEGLFLDPVYTAKAFAGLPGLLADGTIQPGQRVLFLHTGGLPALFGYQGDL